MPRYAVELAAVGCLAAAAAWSDAVPAESQSASIARGAETDTLGEVVVSARRSEERLQDTPIAITVFSANDLEARNITNLAGIGSFTPNLVFDQGTGNTGGSTSSQIYIRGIGQADFLFTTEPGVGVYVDGIYLPRSIGSIMDLIDIERIEVLKGPQGTLFGKNSVGGAISIVTQRPPRQMEARAALTVGDFERRDVTVSIGGPLAGDRLFAKAAFITRERDGFVKRVNDDSDMGNVDSRGARVQLEWLASDSVNLLLSADYTRKREHAIADSLLSVDQSGGLLALWNGLVAPGLGTTYDDRFISSDGLTSYGTGPNYSNLDVWGVSATLTWDLTGGTTFKSLTSYRDQDARFGIDTDHSPLTYFEQSVTDTSRQYSQEFQLNGTAADSRLKWVLGTLFFREKGDDGYRVIFAPGLYTALEALPSGIIPGLGGAGNAVHPTLDFNGLISTGITSNSYSAFVHGSYSFTNALSMSLGGRYTYDKKELTSRFDRLTAGVTTHDIATADNWSAFTPKLGFEYRWTADVMTYVSAARGFKSGGFNGRPTTAFIAQRPFDPEYVTTYEIGVKSAEFARRMTLNGAIFWSDYSDMQLLSVASDPQGGIVAIVENAGKARIKGFELDLSILPVAGLRLDAGIGYIDAEYTQLDDVVTAITLDSKLVKTPKWSYNAGAQYSAKLSQENELILRADYSYRSRVENVANNVAAVAQKGFGLLGARATLRAASGRWEFSASGTNLTDERYITNGLSVADTLGTTDVSYGRPREWGLSVQYSY